MVDLFEAKIILYNALVEVDEREQNDQMLLDVLKRDPAVRKAVYLPPLPSADDRQRLVVRLHKETHAGLMRCRFALHECAWEYEKALDFVQEKLKGLQFRQFP